jgi:ribonucleoside-diphosphate reductase alpha chain
LRRSGHAVRHHDQRLAYLLEHRAHQCLQSLFEYMHLDNSACNLASLNLLKYLREDGVFDTESFRRAVDIIILAQDILIDNSSIRPRRSPPMPMLFASSVWAYANLGALLMTLGLPYDSDAGRAYAGAVTALMSGQGYLQSARNAAATGTFAGYELNRQPMLRVLNKHRSQAYKISPSHVPLDLLAAAREAWDQTCAEAEKFGVKNSQISVLAPTGTIAFMMDCDTTGVEPDIALIKYKKLVGWRHAEDDQQHRAARAQAFGLRRQTESGDRRVH